MRILHLAFEDPRQPGSGGGSVRTYEINRRLSQQHQITCVVAGYRSARPRVEHGVRWLPLGTRTGTKLDQLSYFALLRWAVQRHPHDLLVEDFAAPFSTGFGPRFTVKPTVASVQWLFARQMREKYYLPFDMVERAGLPHYHHFVAVSDWLAAELRHRRPGAEVVTVANGVEGAAFANDLLPPRHLLFVGRLDTAQKGCDLLIEAMAHIHKTLGSATPPLLIVGDGPDRPVLEALVRQQQLAGHIRFLGRVTGTEKYQLLAQAYALLMPSRFETFGMVAAEGQAAGAPVVAFEVGPLRDVAGGGGALLVPPFDVAAFAQAAVRCVRYAAGLLPLRHAGQAWAQRYSWDSLAPQQGQFYEQVAAAGTRTLPAINHPIRNVAGTRPFMSRRRNSP
ncbi:MAG: glycosyltransferase family 4 protein [Chloroflexaceae bacterium]|jgi:glycosyltransferase involved in cell wall biosynthesis|nr:glycosyltransferase family 4 protein [Chloroflexaceae bacterium]